MSARTALAFLTRLPTGDRAPLTSERLSRALLWAPVVGLLVGAIAGSVRIAADLVLGATPATVLALLAAVLVTGALHEDGLADTADALGAHVSRERRLEIMRDPRVGSYGALALVFALLLALTLLSPLDGEHFLRAALVGHAVGRAATLPLALALPSARPDGSGALVRPTPATAVAASAIAVATALIAGGVVAGAVALGVACLLTAACALVFARALGGVSGDTFGAATKVVEIGCYAALVAVWSA